ncbi:MAG: endolytic transglycosylase MltG [Deltaproteobacteria bacterium]|nr:endolytic transglycosylase MltG [Deltaproteobacteria bacterium]
MKRFSVVLIFVAFMAGTLIFYSFQDFLYPPAPALSQTRIVRIQSGMGLRQITRLLTEAGIIRDPNKFMLLSWWKGVGKKIQWGDFELSTGLPPTVILDYLITGKTMLKRITIPEGFTLKQIADRLIQENIVSGPDFISAAWDENWLAELGVDGASLEGYLFPDTYLFHRGMSVKAIQKMMVKRFQEIYKLCQGADSDWSPLGLTRYQIVTLASVVEKETGIPEERPLIASVFYNRLKKGMLLQSDPTVIYGIKNFAGDLTRKHLETPTLYNTYTRPGLPAGPIANPGEAALRAVLHPTASDYYYFVSRNDGSHYFSRTLQEHNRAVARYQHKGEGL